MSRDTNRNTNQKQKQEEVLKEALHRARRVASSAMSNVDTAYDVDQRRQDRSKRRRAKPEPRKGPTPQPFIRNKVGSVGTPTSDEILLDEILEEIVRKI